MRRCINVVLHNYCGNLLLAIAAQVCAITINIFGVFAAYNLYTKQYITLYCNRVLTHLR